MNHSSTQPPDTDANAPPKKPRMHEDDAKGAAVRMKPMKMPEDTPRGVAGLLLGMADVKKLRHVEMVTEFMCIGGWSEIVYWGGARLRDFIAAFPPTGLLEYIGFETPDAHYNAHTHPQPPLPPHTLHPHAPTHN